MMHVNKLHFLRLSKECRLRLRNKFISCSILFTPCKSNSTQTYGYDSTSSITSVQTCSSSTSSSNSPHLNFSRFSASTIMKHCSKSFSFMDYDVIGFDLDGTVLRYNLAEMVPLEFDLLCQYLVQCKGYSSKIIGNLKTFENIDLLQKGLFLDAERGNILKLRKDGYILKANHGTKSMSDDDILTAYGATRQWSATTQFIEDPMCAWNGPLAEKMRSVLDYFDISASLVFALAVDEEDAKRKLSGNQNKSYKVWPDILDGLIHLYTRDHFSSKKSEYFEKLKSEPDRYLLKTSPNVINWLKKLKASNKMLFLLTGSYIDFANFTASYAMGENWRDLFDVVICFARKPGFFHASRQFKKIEGFDETYSVQLNCELKMNSVYSMGNWNQLLNSFASKMSKNSSDVKSLYIGDNLVQDVYAPMALANVDSVAVSEEMLAEYSSDESYDPTKFDFQRCIASNYWNSYFLDNGEQTLWTKIIAKYSQMCIPTLDHVAINPVDYIYYMDNGTGFYPSAPIEKKYRSLITDGKKNFE